MFKIWLLHRFYQIFKKQFSNFDGSSVNFENVKHFNDIKAVIVDFYSYSSRRVSGQYIARIEGNDKVGNIHGYMKAKKA